MTKFISKLGPDDCAWFEEKKVIQIHQSVLPSTEDADEDQSCIYRIIFASSDIQHSEVKATEEEFKALISQERLLIEWGGLGREKDYLFGRRSINTLQEDRRSKAFRSRYLAELIEDLRGKRGMPLTIEGIKPYLLELQKKDAEFQRVAKYGVTGSRPSQTLKAFPSAFTLLKYRRQQSSDEPLRQRKVSESAELTLIEEGYRIFALGSLKRIFEEFPHISVNEACNKLQGQIVELHDRQRAEGVLHPITPKSPATYRRWFRKEVDLFWEDAVRLGLKFATEKHGINDQGLLVRFIGQRVEIDSWRIHILTLAVSRQAYLTMTEEERAKVPRVRLWVIILLDSATRCILGFCICDTPTQEAAIKALRMATMDKTYLFERIGLKGMSWSQKCMPHNVVFDNGGEFGRDPRFLSKFRWAVTAMAGAAMATVAGLPKLRAKGERFNGTGDSYMARYAPGYSGRNIKDLHGRKPELQACLTRDDVDDAFTAFVARYHVTTHRMLGMTPAEKWKELSSSKLYVETLPSPEVVRNATGRHCWARLTRDGIVHEGIRYVNEAVRTGHYGTLGSQVEIIVDDFNLGAISVLRRETAETVRALEDRFHGMHLSDWTAERQRVNAQKKLSRDANILVQKQAIDNMTETMKRAASVAGIKSVVPTDEEIAWARANLEIGKGSNDRPFISAADPLPLSEPIIEVDAANPMADGTLNPDAAAFDEDTPSELEASPSSEQPQRKLKPREKYRNWRADPSALKRE